MSGSSCIVIWIATVLFVLGSQTVLNMKILKFALHILVLF
jgi:hypothetical protein